MKKIISVFALLLCFTASVYAQNIVDTNKWYQLENALSKGKMANNGQKSSGAVMIAKKVTSTGGHWRFIRQNNGLYRIQNRDSKMFLANFGASNRGSKLKQTKTPGSGALWRVIKLPKGSILIQNNMTSMFVGIIENKDKTALVQAAALSTRIAWRLIPVQKQKPVVTNGGSGLPKNTNFKAFKAKRGGRVAKVIVRYTDQISFIGEKPRVGQRVYFFPQQLARANPDKISFNPKRPSICGETYIVTQVVPEIKFNKKMPNLRNRNNDNFMFVVEIF